MTDDLDTLRRDSLRTFNIERQDGSNEQLQAHYHDGGQTPPGHLSFFTVDADGFQRIFDTFNVHDWLRVTDITPPEDKAKIDTLRQLATTEASSTQQ